MSCDDLKFDGAFDPGRCKCQGAVLRAYSGLIEAGQPECNALEAALIVYRHHHPEDSKADASLIVERWVHAGHFH
ncbi:MAG: hypothetical protein KDI13_03725 [Alphaproteobacteria bacterium]|nr:hypothetical protein [Alphaproteobacteria bacterium]